LKGRPEQPPVPTYEGVLKVFSMKRERRKGKNPCKEKNAEGQ